MRFAHRQTCFAGKFLVTHLVEPAYGHACVLSKPSQLTNEFLIRTANDHGESFRFRAEGRDVRKVACRDDDRASVLDNEWMCIADSAADRLDLGTRLAGAKDQRDLLPA